MKNPINILNYKLIKRISIWMLLFGFVAVGAPLRAEDKAPAKQESKEDLATLKELLKMPKDDLKRVRLTLESIEKMTPSDRTKALQRIQELNKMPSEQRKETIDRWNELSPEMKKAYFDYLRKLPAKERTKFKALPWEKQI
jgi:phage-related protein